MLPIDILHLDACSMALLDVAYEVRHKVDYVIAPQYIGWSFFAYADFSRYITEWTEPDQLATLIAQRYANLAAAYNLPYTISALDMSRIEQLKKAVDELAKQLKSWVNIDTNASGRRMRMFRDIRGLSLDDRSQFFDSNNNYLNTPRDGYVDLQDFAERVARAELTPDVTKAAADLLAEYNRPDSVVLTNLHSSVVDLPGKQREATEVPIDLTRASGLSLFYPAEGGALLSLPLILPHRSQRPPQIRSATHRCTSTTSTTRFSTSPVPRAGTNSCGHRLGNRRTKLPSSRRRRRLRHKSPVTTPVCPLRKAIMWPTRPTMGLPQAIACCSTPSSTTRAPLH